MMISSRDEPLSSSGLPQSATFPDERQSSVQVFTKSSCGEEQFKISWADRQESRIRECEVGSTCWVHPGISRTTEGGSGNNPDPSSVPAKLGIPRKVGINPRTDPVLAVVFGAVGPGSWCFSFSEAPQPDQCVKVLGA